VETTTTVLLPVVVIFYGKEINPKAVCPFC